MAKKIALGKGIASLISDSPNELLKQSLNSQTKKMDEKTEKKIVSENETSLVDITQIHANPNQPRKIFKDKELQELSDSIKENGVIQPLIVAKADKGFELIAGERRLRASKIAGLEKVPVVIKTGTDRDKMVMAIIENVQRSDLNCVEEALAYFQLLNEYNLTQEEVAKKLGKERSSVANFLRILKLPRQVIDLLQKELLTFGHAKVLVAEKDTDKVKRLATIAVEEKLSIRELERLLKKKVAPVKEKKNKFFDEKLDSLRQTLEKNTGFHFDLKSKSSGKGQIIINYTNEAEFNDIYEYLLK